MNTLAFFSIEDLGEYITDIIHQKNPDSFCIPNINEKDLYLNLQNYLKEVLINIDIYYICDVMIIKYNKMNFTLTYKKLSCDNYGNIYYDFFIDIF